MQLYRDLCVQGGDTRFPVLTDSAVCLGSHQKGRSSARLLCPSLRKAGAVAIAGGLYPAPIFAPTRLNPADDPTRDQACRLPCKSSLLSHFRAPDLAVFGSLTRPRANWVRLCLFLGSSCSGAECFCDALRAFPESSRLFGRVPRHFSRAPLDFDATLGFPGEGPARLTVFCFMLLCGPLGLCFAVLLPRGAADVARLRHRAPDLRQGRPVQDRTRSNRGWLTEAFSQWLVEVAGFSLEHLLGRKPFDPEELSDWVVAYGRDLYGSSSRA